MNRPTAYSEARAELGWSPDLDDEDE